MKSGTEVGAFGPDAARSDTSNWEIIGAKDGARYLFSCRLNTMVYQGSQTQRRITLSK
jgi:hypothetical protein